MPKARKPIRIFINADDPTSPDARRVALTTHFPGPTEVFHESVRDDTPGGPYVERAEVRGLLTVNTTTFQATRVQVVALWPEALQLIPLGSEQVTVSIESMIPSQTGRRLADLN